MPILQSIASGAGVKLLMIGGKLMTACCCESSSSAAPGASSSAAPGAFPGAGWYCVKLYLTPLDDFDCGNLACKDEFTSCANITTEAAWDSYDFGACNINGTLDGMIMYTTDEVKHDTEEDCTNAGCSC